MERLINNEAELVVAFPTVISAEGVHCQFDIPAPACKASVAKHVQTINLGAWYNDPTFVDMEEGTNAVRKDRFLLERCVPKSG